MSQQQRVRRDWPSVFAAYEASGLSISAFCRAHGVPRGLFHKRQRQQRGATVTAGFVELRPATAPVPHAGIALVSGTWRIEVEPDFDAPTLCRVCACLERAAPCSG